jgi:hypothetical protein
MAGVGVLIAVLDCPIGLVGNRTVPCFSHTDMAS